MSATAPVIVHEDGCTRACNLACSYCRVDRMAIEPRRDLLEHSEQVRRAVRERHPGARWKVSGRGEFLSYPGALDALRVDGAPWLITNGTTFSGDVAEALARTGAVVSFSLDGHEPALNVHRGAAATNGALRGLRRAIDHGLPVEINSVLTVANTADYHRFLDWLLEQGAVTAMPFPVRPFGSRPLAVAPPSPSDIDAFEERVLAHYAYYRTVLPPEPYIAELVAFMRTGRRTLPCALPALTVTTDPTFQLVACPCGWDALLGSALHAPHAALDARDQLVDEIARGERAPDSKCWCCFTHYEVLNLFAAGRITIDELVSVPAWASLALTNQDVPMLVFS